MSDILVVDDEKRMRDLIELYLLPYGYKVQQAGSGKEALDFLKEKPFDLVILDIMMEEVDGFETCRRIRTFSDIPILMLTAKDQKTDILRGLKIGADDYVTKPFDEEILAARIDTLLRRNAPSAIEMDGLYWDEGTYQLSYKGDKISLTPKEFKLIGLLLKRPDHVYDRNDLLDLVWGFESDTEGRTIDSHIRNIREKIKQTGFPVEEHLKTVWGVGYKWTSR